MKMTLAKFLDENRGELDRLIRAQVGPNFDLDDDARSDWIMNDEGLYLWAKGEGVDLEDDDDKPDEDDDDDTIEVEMADPTCALCWSGEEPGHEH